MSFLAATSGADEPGRLEFDTLRTRGFGGISTLSAGTGPETILCVHGLGGTKASFLPTVNALADDYRVVAIDLPGFGESDKPIGAPYDAPWFARSVFAAMDTLGIERAHVAGNSMGALVGGIYAYGYSPAEMDSIVRGLDWDTLLSDASRREDRAFRRKEDDREFLAKIRLGFRDGAFRLPKGLVQGHAVGNLLRALLPTAHHLERFESLPVPFRAVATEITTGEVVVLEHVPQGRVGLADPRLVQAGQERGPVPPEGEATLRLHPDTSRDGDGPSRVAP